MVLKVVPKYQSTLGRKTELHDGRRVKRTFDLCDVGTEFFIAYARFFREKQGPDREIDLLDDSPFDDIEDISGVYIISSSDGTRFIYPKGNNSVIYIGKSEHLVQRLKDHLANLKMVVEYDEELLCNRQQVNQRYQYMNSFGAKVFIYYCRKTQNAKWLESYIMHRFYKKFRALPVGNGARSFSD